MKFQFDHAQLIKYLLPCYAKAKKLAWLGALISPLQTLYAEFLVLQARLNIEAVLNSQVGVLEWYLNELFDPQQRRILILDSVSFAAPIRAYLQTENKPRLAAYLQSEGFPKMITGEVVEYSGEDFIVQIPGSLSGSEKPISRVVEKYKMGGKTFKITTV